MSATDAPKPWYRQVWPWLLMVPPAASVVAGLGLAYLAVHDPSPLVVDDYANIEQIAREESDADRRAGELGLDATLTLRPDRTGGVSVAAEIPRRTGSSLPPTLVLRLRHVANPAADRTLKLDYDGSAYRGHGALAVGRYDFDLGPADRSWRLAGTVGNAPTTVHVAATRE